MARPTRAQYFMNIAATVATRSTCPSLQVGAILVDEHQNIVAAGYNGAPKGMTHCDHNSSVAITGVVDEPCHLVIHAEVNAILRSKEDPSVCIMYSTHGACMECAKIMVQVGLKEVVYESPYHRGGEEVFTYLRLGGVVVREYKG